MTFSRAYSRFISITEYLFKVTPDLCGCPPVSSGKKIRMRAIFKESTANYILLESLIINVNLGKNMNCQFFLNSTKQNCKYDRENDHVSFNQTNELIGYQTSAEFCNNWPEHSLDVLKQKLCWGFFNL